MPGGGVSAGPLPEGVLDEIEALYLRGLFLQARAAGEQHRPMRAWRGPRALLLASRLCDQLGDSRRAQALTALAWRGAPRDLSVRTAYARRLLARAGPYSAWQLVRRHGDVEAATRLERAEWLGLEATILAMLRDFPTARSYMARALADAPEESWLWVEQSFVLTAEDRQDEALTAARRALELRPRYAAAVHATVESLRRLARLDEALTLLRETVPVMESFLLTNYLVGLLVEREAYAEAEPHARRLAELAPLLRPPGVAHLRGIASDIAYHLGDDTTALTLAREAGPGFHARIALNLETWKGPPRRVRLPVPFVQQHFRTCGPATLTSLARFWGFTVDHVELARQIAYEGTWDHEERHWAETALGCVVREFTVTWAAAVTLIDEGVPFSLATVHPTWGHLQAVIGYDARRGTLLVMDPYSGPGEYVATLLDDHAASGPRGMALVPKSEAARLEGCRLPDASRWDALYRLKRALAIHDREGAGMEADALAAEAPEDRLALEARRHLASYDGDLVTALACTDALLARYPDSEWLASQKYTYLGTLARRSERLALVEAMLARPTCDPVWWQHAAAEYRDDARTWPRAERCAQRTLRRMPTVSVSYYSLAVIRSQQRRHDEARALARFAACLDPTSDFLGEYYVWQAAVSGRIEEALDLLRWRVRSYGTQSSRPVQTLFACLARTYRFAEAFEILATGLQARVNDPELMLFAAREYGRDGDHERARLLLARARPAARPALWARTAAEIEASEGNLTGAVELWRDVVSALPLDVAAHASLARALNQLEGYEAACAYLRDVAARWPHHFGIQQQYVEWLRLGDTAERLQVLERLVHLHPTFLWGWRELAWLCRQEGRLREAAAAADAALSLDPHSSYSHATRGAVHAASGEHDAAVAAFREAIRLDVDNAFAVAELVACCDTQACRRDALAFVRAELERQTVFGPGLGAYRDAARAVLPAEEVLARCRDALAARPDLLPAWTETIRQLLDMGDAPASLELADRAIAQFPVIAELHALRAHAALLGGDHAQRLEALARARALAPLQSEYGVSLGQALRDAGRLDEACRVLEDTIRRSPGDIAAHLALADVFWMTGRRAEAGTAVEQVIQRAVDEPGAWERLQRWSVELGDREDPVALARRLTMERPRDGRAWKALASVLTGDEAVDALRRAVELTPRDEYARDALAIALANTGRHDEALEVCEAPILGSRPPLILRGRAAWLEAARGRRDAAIARMRRVLEEAPSYTWGWSQLATWSADAGDHDPAMEAAGWLTRLAPGDASAWAQLGHLQLITGRREDGKATLRRALELDPHHESAGFVLIDALVEDRELDAADALVARLARRGTDEWLAVRVVAIAAARHQRSAAGTAFAELCAIPSVGLAALQAGARALVNENWADLAHEVVRRRAEEASASADVAVAYATSEADRLHPGWDLDVFAAYVRNNPNGGSAAAAFLNRLVERRIPKAGRALQKACRTLFERDVAVWGTYAYLLLEDGRRAEVVAWMKDWQHRDGRQPWMLLNLAVALRGLGDWAAAAAVHRHAERLPGDHTTAEHQAWLALDDALAGRLDEARRRLDACDPEHLNSYYRALRQLVLACLESATDATRGMMLLGVAADTHRMRSEAALTRAYRRCRAVLLRRRGGLVDRLVAWLLDLAATR